MQAMMGKALQLRPLLTFDSDGKLRVIEKIMGTKKAIKTLFDKFVSQYDETSPCPIQLAFAGENYVADLRKMIMEKFLNANIQEGPVGPVIASHTGPALTAVIFYSKEKRI